MKFTDDTKTEFELEVVSYQFPQLENEAYDSDWLNIRVTVEHPRGSWSKTDSCLLTFELAGLADWLSKIAEEMPAVSEADFIEPELSFKWIGEGNNCLSIYLDYSLRPEWCPYDGPNQEDELFVTFAVTADDLRNAAGSLRHQLQKFPVRVQV